MARFHVDRRLPAWRRVALSTWRRGDDPTIYGWIDIEASALQAYVKRLRETSGAKVTVTHVIGKAIALAFAAHPECNGVVSMGRFKRRDSVDVFFQVALDGGRDLSGAKVVGADRLGVPDIARALDAQATRIRESKDTALQKSQSIMKRVPPAVLAPVLRLSEALMYDAGLDLSALGIPFDPFGTVMVTNVGVFGIDHGFAPLLPIARIPALLTVGAIHDAVVPVNGEPAVRPVLTIGGTFDHRVIDGYGVGKLATVLRRVLTNPEAELG
jgi:pyruvate dehydrogenase E2 component (dihydrolipoamide acetyltransferase)